VTATFDSNILVYATGRSDDPKCGRARELVAALAAAGNGVVLVQALAEFSAVAIRKAGIPARQVLAGIEALRSAFPVEAARYEDLPAALSAVERDRLSFWDALLWASARRAGVRFIFTEDFQDGRTLGGVRFIDPFATGNASLIGQILAG
jgi:predicted nucleic acid-binding protein